ncbi:MAG: endolytic transglycosylase MltG [Muribaculaceae bacterium]|nr:endolytic transglycosylase MltG [Muribaculaceae bacterium]
MKKFCYIFLSLLIVLAVAGLYAYNLAFSTYTGECVRINIPENTTPQQTDSIIRGALPGQFGSKVARLWNWSVEDPASAHGSYLIEPGQKAWRVAQNIRRGRQTPVTVTFNNVRTLRQLAEKIADQLELTSDQFSAACDTLLPARGYAGQEEFPAAFLPDSYEFYWTATPASVVKRLADSRDKFWNDTRRAKAAALGLRPVEVATIASIVEEETANKEERPMIARLYLNRVAKGMKLQADPTVKFATGDFTLRRITGAHLRTPSPYNTYLHQGLPPGPIRIVDRSTLQAVLDAPRHNYLYMCAKEDFSGTHNFATDYQTHMANARRYQAALNKRGIK